VLKYKVGDTVRIQSKERLRVQDVAVNSVMLECANRIAKIIGVNDAYDCYSLDIDNGDWSWTDGMFDPDYNADDPLAPEDAIRAMMDDGEALINKEGRECLWNGVSGYFQVMVDSVTALRRLDLFTDLRRRPAKRNRPMTRWEVLDWANSEASRGWVVRVVLQEMCGQWAVPQCHYYDEDVTAYQRARLLPDLSGVDESTIQGFEVDK
jgi:hypothetical protein